VKRAIGAIQEVLEKMGVKQLEPVLRRSQVG
jgi:hypothetical protein